MAYRCVIIQQGHRFNWCEGAPDRWYVQREGRTAAYGEGYATREDAEPEAARIAALWAAEA